MPRYARYPLLPLVLLLFGLLLNCSRAPELPTGLVLSGEAAPLLRFLEQLASLEGTPLAELAQSTRQRLEGCRHVRGTGEDLHGLAASIECDNTPTTSVLEALREDAHLVWSLQLAEGRHLIGRGRLEDDSSASFSAELPRLPGEAPLALLLPSADAPGPTLLSREEALVQARLKADRGFDLSRLLPEEEQVKGLFQLKSRIFSGLVLEGSWEVVVYTPEEGELIPPMAAAIEFTRRSAAEKAWNDYLQEVENAWGFVPEPITLGPHAGACVNEVRVLPGLAPCYVLTERALVLGWNRAALDQALGGTPATELSDQSRLVVELEHLPQADALLTHSLRERLGAEAETTEPVAYPWRRLTLSGRREAGRYLIEGRLVAKESR